VSASRANLSQSKSSAPASKKVGKSIIEIRDAWKIYKMGSVDVSAIKGIDAKIDEGDFVAIIGASGSGKSTMMHLVGALDVPTSGQVLLDGVDITKLTESELARIRGLKIGFIFQSFNLYPSLSVYENIALPMRIHEFPDKEIALKVPELIRKVGLEHREHHLPSQLSGGERQRVAIARALSTSPAMILADEPTGNLDTKTSLEIMALFKELNEKEGRTVVLVTHEQDIAAFAHRVITLRDGKVVSDRRQKGD